MLIPCDEVNILNTFRVMIILRLLLLLTNLHLKLLSTQQGWGQVQYLYLCTYLSVLDVLEYLVYGNAKVLVLDQKVLGTYK